MLNRCPNCRKKAIKISEKLSLRFYETTNCNNCGIVLGLPWWTYPASIIVLIPTILLCVIVKGINEYYMVFILVLFLFIIFITQLIVPLKERPHRSFISKN